MEPGDGTRDTGEGWRGLTGLPAILIPAVGALSRTVMPLPAPFQPNGTAAVNATPERSRRVLPPAYWARIVVTAPGADAGENARFYELGRFGFFGLLVAEQL